MEIKGYSFTVAPGSPNENMMRLYNLQEAKGFPVIKNFIIPQKAEYDLIYVTLKHINTGANYLVNAPLSALRQNYIIPLNLPVGEYEIIFNSENLVNVRVNFGGVVDFAV